MLVIDVVKFFVTLPVVAEQVIEVPTITLEDTIPQRAPLRAPQLAEQLVEVPLPAAGVVQAWVCDANGQIWSRIWDSTGRIYWWRLGSGDVQWNTPPGITASPRAAYKYWARMRIFYGPLHLAVTCSVLVCLRSTCVDFLETTSGILSLFSASWFDSGYMFLPVYGGFVRGSCVRFSSCSLCYRQQRTARSSVIHVLRQSTEWLNFLFSYVNRWITDPEVDSRLSEHVLRPLESDSHLHGVRVRLWSTRLRNFLGISGIIYVFSTLVRQWIHVGVSL